MEHPRWAVWWLVCIICHFTCSDTFGCVVPKHSQLYSHTTSSLTVKYIIWRYDALIIKADLVRLGRCFQVHQRTLKVGGGCWEISGRGVQVIFHLIVREIQVCRKHKMGSCGLSGDHKGKVQTMQHHFNHWQEKPSNQFLPLIYCRATERLGHCGQVATEKHTRAHIHTYRQF